MASLTRAFSRLARQVIRTSATRCISTATPLLSTQPDMSRLWKVGKLNHVAIAVPDLQKATSLYKDVLGAKVSEVMPQPDHGVSVVFVELGDTKIELLHPLGDSPITNFLEKNKAGGIHHVCIEVNDIDAAVADLQQQNLRTLWKETRIGAHGKPVMFLHPKDCTGVLVELEQE